MTTSQNVIDANAKQLELFVKDYVLDRGIQVQLVETVAKTLFGQQVVVNGIVPEDVATAPKELVSTAITDIVDFGFLGDTTYNLETLLDGAASLEFLVRYARQLDPKIMPPAVVPTDEVVNAALVIFHERKVAGSLTA